MSCPSHPPWLDHSNYTWRREQVPESLTASLNRLQTNKYIKYHSKPFHYREREYSKSESHIICILLLIVMLNILY
jgi:hypothetical protein